VSPETVAAALSDRTGAVVVTHLFGNPVDVAAVRAVLPAGVTVIEDAAQAFLAERDGRSVGSLGDIGCFSFQQGKHITSGEGGIVVTDDDRLAREIRLFVNKSWPYGEPQPDHRKLGLNYRITELQSAVLLAQLPRLPEFVAHRRKLAEALSSGLARIPGMVTPPVAATAEHAFWRYPLVVDGAVVPDGVTRLATRLRATGVPAAPRYIGKPAFRCGVFADRRTLGSSGWPFTLARPEALDYDAARFPGTFAFLDSVLVLPWNERFDETHVDLLLATIGDEVRR
jgi:perosamine synthetase